MLAWSSLALQRGPCSPLVWCQQRLRPSRRAGMLAGEPIRVSIHLLEKLVERSPLWLPATGLHEASTNPGDILPGRHGSPCWPPVSPKLSLAPICTGGQAGKKAKTCGAIPVPPLRCQHFQPSGNTCERCTFVNLQLDNYATTHGVTFEIHSLHAPQARTCADRFAKLRISIAKPVGMLAAYI